MQIKMQQIASFWTFYYFWRVLLFQRSLKPAYLLFSVVPGKPILSVNQTQENTLLVKWEPPLGSEGQVQGYRLQFGRKDIDPLATLEFMAQEDKYTAINIHKGATYVFKLAVKSPAGFGEEAMQEFTIPEDVPKGYPQILEASNITSRSVQFNWLPPVLAESNGVIVKYTVVYREAGSSGNPQEKELPPSLENSYVLNGLKPNTAYDVKIRAHTSKGPGPYSPTVQYRTFLLDQGRTCWFLLCVSPCYLSCYQEAEKHYKLTKSFIGRNA